MPVPQIEDVRPHLEEYELRIRAVMESAWSDWQRLPNTDRIIFDKTTRANCVFNYIKRRAVIEFSEDPKVRVIPKGRTAKFLFHDRVLVRFKKANRLGLGSNITTQDVLEFVDPQIPLLALPEICNIEVVYQEDDYSTRVASIAVTCRKGFRKLWSYELKSPPAAAVIPIPHRDDGGSPPPATAIPRQRADKPENEKGE